jgi:hypothetical protein
MLTKVYLATAIVFIFVLGFVTYYSASWLGSITTPADAFAGYEYFRGLAWGTLWITSGILLILANILMVKSSRNWALWGTFAYFCVFVLILGFILRISEIGFLRDKGFAPETSAYLSPFLAVALCVGSGVLVYADQLLINRMWNRPIDPSGSDSVNGAAEKIIGVDEKNET